MDELNLTEILQITQVKKSARKTYSIIINKNLTVTFRCPRSFSANEISNILSQNLKWINKHLQKIEKENLAQKDIKKLTDSEIRNLYQSARMVIPDRVEYFANIMNVKYGNITIRSQKTRWGSCSSKGNLNFNCLLIMMPMEVLDSVVVHELCHLLEHNHSKKFYKLVYKYYPEYDKYDKWLKQNGNKYMAMIGY